MRRYLKIKYRGIVLWWQVRFGGSVTSVLVSINVVARRRARLVLGWVSLWEGKTSRNATSHPRQLSLAIIPCVGAMNTVAVLGKNIWGAWPLIIWKATTAKRNLL